MSTLELKNHCTLEQSRHYELSWSQATEHDSWTQATLHNIYTWYHAAVHYYHSWSEAAVSY